MTKKNAYRNNVELLRQLPLFYQPWWLDVVAQNWEVIHSKEEQKTLAVFPFQTENKFGVKLLRNPLLCPYLGPFFLFSKEEGTLQHSEEEMVVELLNRLPKWDYLQFTTVPGFKPSSVLEKRNFTVKNRVTYLLNLQDTAETIFSNFQPRLRSYIRKAEKLLRVETGMPADLTQFCSFHRIAFANKETPYPFTPQLVTNIVQAAETHRSSLFQTAYDSQGRPLAMLWTPFDTQTAYHLLAATNPESDVNGALALLVWRAVQFFKQRGLSFYDFEGSMDEGIAQFFKKFGGKQNTYFFIEKNKSLVWKMKKNAVRIKCLLDGHSQHQEGIYSLETGAFIFRVESTHLLQLFFIGAALHYLFE